MDGDQVALVSGGSGKGALYYTGQKWQFYANALYQLPWGIDLSGTAWGRAGRAEAGLPQRRGRPGRHAPVAATPTSRRALRRRLGLRPASRQDVPLRQAGVPHARRRVVQRGELRPGADPHPPGQRRGLQPDRRGAEPQHLPSRRDLRLLAGPSRPYLHGPGEPRGRFHLSRVSAAAGPPGRARARGAPSRGRRDVAERRERASHHEYSSAPARGFAVTMPARTLAGLGVAALRAQQQAEADARLRASRDEPRSPRGTPSPPRPPARGAPGSRRGPRGVPHDDALLPAALGSMAWR